jgi:DNA polymerase III alpha subunit
MISDKFGNVIYQQQDLIELLYSGFTNLHEVIVEPFEGRAQFEEFANLKLKTLHSSLDQISVEEFDQVCQSDWFIPEEYKGFDVKLFCLERCHSVEASTRVIEELTAFEEKNMMVLLRTLKYLVDTLKQNNIVWGVGRGSSVASYVLFLLEVHKIDSLKYNLDWHEFLR